MGSSRHRIKFSASLFLFAMRFFILPWRYSFSLFRFAVWFFSFCHEVVLFAVSFFFSFCREVFLFAARLFFWPWVFFFSFCREVNSFAVTVMGHRDCVYYSSNPFRNERVFENSGIFGHVNSLDQSRASENIWWILDICPHSVTWKRLDQSQCASEGIWRILSKDILQLKLYFSRSKQKEDLYGRPLLQVVFVAVQYIRECTRDVIKFSNPKLESH